MTNIQQFLFPQAESTITHCDHSYEGKLLSILSGDLNFLKEESGHSSHKVHSFPAKFPSQLPRKFIVELTEADDMVLDPMMGSGTTVLEASLANRQAIGFDIDPLALLLSRVKTTPFDTSVLNTLGVEILSHANNLLRQQLSKLKTQIEKRFDSKSREFIDYWFASETQLELMALLIAIEETVEDNSRDFFYLVFSSVIITKTGGVSLALDLAHTRPHKAKVVVTKDGRYILGEDLPDKNSPKVKILTKTLRSPIEEFDKRLRQNVRGVISSTDSLTSPKISYGDAQSLPLKANSVDLIVTSPPYASNAIDYMRAHKFSLVWLGHDIQSLMKKRKTYIGAEGAAGISLVDLPQNVATIIKELSKHNKSKGKTLHRYYSEMFYVLQEMFRVLKYGKAAIVVVGNSTISGHDAKVQSCLIDIGKEVGFEIAKVGIRQLDRNKRMLPAGLNLNLSSQIQQRMHEEYVIGFYKSSTRS